MYRITEIEASGGRFAVRVISEDEPVGEKYIVAKEFFAPLALGEGDVIGDEELSSLSRAAELTAAVSKALDVISYSNLSRQALIDKLRLKYRVERSLAEEAADYAVRRRYIDEDAQAKKIAAAAVRTKLWGTRRVVAELMAKGYPKSCAEDAASSVGDGEYGAALKKLIDRKVAATPADRSEYNKLVASLVRLGHSPGDIKAALKDKIKEYE